MVVDRCLVLAERLRSYGPGRNIEAILTMRCAKRSCHCQMQPPSPCSLPCLHPSNLSHGCLLCRWRLACPRQDRHLQ